jgi:hypothetical protein
MNWTTSTVSLPRRKPTEHRSGDETAVESGRRPPANFTGLRALTSRAGEGENHESEES